MRTIFKGQNLRRTHLQIWRNVNFLESAYPTLEPLKVRDVMMRETAIAVQPDGRFSDVKRRPWTPVNSLTVCSISMKYLRNRESSFGCPGEGCESRMFSRTSWLMPSWNTMCLMLGPKPPEKLMGTNSISTYTREGWHNSARIEGRGVWGTLPHWFPRHWRELGNRRRQPERNVTFYNHSSLVASSMNTLLLERYVLLRSKISR